METLFQKLKDQKLQTMPLKRISYCINTVSRAGPDYMVSSEASLFKSTLFS